MQAGKLLTRIDSKAVMNGFCLGYALAYAQKLQTLIEENRLFTEVRPREGHQFFTPLGLHVTSVLSMQFPGLATFGDNASEQQIAEFQANISEILKMFITLDELTKKQS